MSGRSTTATTAQWSEEGPHVPVEAHLLDAEARGWVRKSEFAGRRGWSLTDHGRVEDERLLAAELDAAGAREVATGAHGAFLPLNRRFGTVCTKWQIRPRPGDALAALGDGLQQLLAPLVDALPRLDAHAARYRAALAHVDRGERSWVDAPDRASCHLVWIQVHEDLLATLGVERGTDDVAGAGAPVG